MWWLFVVIVVHYWSFVHIYDGNAIKLRSDPALPCHAVKSKTKVICLPTEHQGVHKTSFRNVRALQDRELDFRNVGCRGERETGVLGENIFYTITAFYLRVTETENYSRAGMSSTLNIIRIGCIKKKKTGEKQFAVHFSLTSSSLLSCREKTRWTRLYLSGNTIIILNLFTSF